MKRRARLRRTDRWLRYAAAGLVVALVAAPAGAEWIDVVRADAEGELGQARHEALRLIAARRSSADAVAAAAWWLRRHAVLADPGEILELERRGMDPELRVALANLEAELKHGRPNGVPAVAELAGPFGSLDTLDLERSRAPEPSEMPPLGAGEGAVFPFHLSVRLSDGWVSPGKPLLRAGVYVAAWTLEVDERRTGWLVLEVRGNADLQLNGRTIDRLRPERRLEASVVWYRIELRPGRHRVRVAFASTRRPSVRVRFLDDAGAPMAARVAVDGRDCDPGAASVIRRQLPPAAERIGGPADDGAKLEELLIGAELAAHREDPTAHRRWLESAVRAAPQSPWPQLLLAELFLNAPTGAAAEVDYGRCRERLRRAGVMPGSQLLEATLDRRQDRHEDGDRVLDALLESAPNDVRVRLLALRRALTRGWRGEVERGLEELSSLLPGSPTMRPLRIEALRALDRWREHDQLLQLVAEDDPFRDGLLGWLLDAGRNERAVEVLNARLDRADDIELALERVGLLLKTGRPAEALEAIVETRGKWGALGELDELEVLARFDAEGVDAARAVLDRALEGSPGRLDMRRLAWRWGATPFYERWRRSSEPLIGAARAQTPEGADSVLFLDQAVERVFADGSSLHYYHGLTLAVTPKGAQRSARVNLLDGAALLRLRVFKQDGRVVVPPETTASADLELAEIEPGDVVETEYVVEMPSTASPVPQHMSPYVYRFADADRAFGLSEYVLVAPSNIEISIEGNLEGVERKREIIDGLDVRTFRVRGAPPFFSEPFAPPEQELLPWVTYGFGVDWTHVGDAVRDAVLPVLSTGPELDAWARDRLAGGDPETQVRRLVEDLYEDVEAGSVAIDPRSTAGQSFSRRRGNRIPIVLTSLLDNGWSVDLVMSRPQPYAGSHLDVPSMTVFGVPVVRASKADREIWIDPAEGEAGIGRVRALLQNSDALILPLDDPTEPVRYLETVPTFDNPQLEERIMVEGRIRADGSGDLETRVALRGERGRELAEMVRTVSIGRAAALYEQIASRMFPGAADVRGVIDAADGAPVLSLSLHLEHACRTGNGDLVCRALVVNEPLAPVLASVPERRYPLVLTVPVQRRHRLQLELPPGWKTAAAERHLESRFGSVHETVERDAGGIYSEIRLVVPAQTVKPSAYPEFVRFCHAVDELMSRPVVLEPRP